MKKTLTISLLLMLFVLASASLMAETELTVGGQIMGRTELDDRSFDPDYKIDKFTVLRTRLNVKAWIEGNTTAFVQLQDSRMLGGETFFGDNASGELNDGKNVDVHQAYIQMDRIWVDGLGAKMGRFEFNLGNQRVFGSVGWSPIARSWEGGQIWFDHEKFKITGFVLKRTEMNNPMGNEDYDVMGLNYHNNKLGADFFVVIDNNAHKVAPDISELKRWSYGTYYHRVHKHMDYTLNFVLQSGTEGEASGAETDISAMLIAFEAGYNMDDDNKTRLAIGVDRTSGSEASDTDNKTYDNMYYTGHKFRGYADYFVGYNVNGLMDIYFKAKSSPWEGWTIGADLHMFSTATEYSGTDGLTKDVGTEIDVTVKTSSVAGVGLMWGASYFMGKDNWVGDGADPGFWAYSMATVNF